MSEVSEVSIVARPNQKSGDGEDSIILPTTNSTGSNGKIYSLILGEEVQVSDRCKEISNLYLIDNGQYFREGTELTEKVQRRNNFLPKQKTLADILTVIANWIFFGIFTFFIFPLATIHAANLAEKELALYQSTPGFKRSTDDLTLFVTKLTNHAETWNEMATELERCIDNKAINREILSEVEKKYPELINEFKIEPEALQQFIKNLRNQAKEWTETAEILQSKIWELTQQSKFATTDVLYKGIVSGKESKQKEKELFDQFNLTFDSKEFIKNLSGANNNLPDADIEHKIKQDLTRSSYQINGKRIVNYAWELFIQEPNNAKFKKYNSYEEFSADPNSSSDSEHVKASLPKVADQVFDNLRNQLKENYSKTIQMLNQDVGMTIKPLIDTQLNPSPDGSNYFNSSFTGGDVINLIIEDGKDPIVTWTAKVDISDWATQRFIGTGLDITVKVNVVNETLNSNVQQYQSSRSGQPMTSAY